jgi:hypothetical protein
MLTDVRVGSCSPAFRAAIVHSSCPDLIRASIFFFAKNLSKKMDGRTIKPGNDDFTSVSLGSLKIESIATNNSCRPGQPGP